MRLIYITHRSEPSRPQTVPESRARISTLFAFLAVVCAAVLGGGMSCAHTATGRIAIAVIFGGLLAVLIAGWIVAVRRPWANL
jgi:hypothetical protein